MKIHFTGDRKIMNMRKVGTFIQSKSRLAAEAETAEKSLKSMAHAIHYANIRHGKGGMVSGIASATCKAGLA